jgi:signal transduction histidine kinase
VFDRFSRGREPRGAGSGLGLAVARELARVDGASISVGEGELGGARLELDYPAAQAEPHVDGVIADAEPVGAGGARPRRR